MSSIITEINHVNAVVAAAIPLSLPVIEALIRLIPSKTPLSLFTFMASFFHGLGDLATTCATGCDSVVPQKLAAPALPVEEHKEA